MVDISGHGPVAGLFALKIKQLLAPALRLGMSPGDALRWVADQLGDTGDQFATCLVVEISPSSGHCRYANAGHPPARRLAPGYLAGHLGSAGAASRFGLQVFHLAGIRAVVGRDPLEVLQPRSHLGDEQPGSSDESKYLPIVGSERLPTLPLNSRPTILGSTRLVSAERALGPLRLLLTRLDGQVPYVVGDPDPPLVECL